MTTMATDELDKEPTKKDLAKGYGILAAMLMGSTVLASAFQPSYLKDPKNITEQNVSVYIDHSLQRRFPEMTPAERARYVPGVVDSISVLEDAPVEDQIGIPDGPEHLKERADYVLNGLYWLDNDEVALQKHCVLYNELESCSKEIRAMTGLHFAPPGSELSTMPLAIPRPDFDSVVADVLAMDGRLDSIEGGLHPVTGIDQVLTELGEIVPYYVRVGLLPSIDAFIPPTSVEWIDLTKDPSMKYVAAYIIVGSSDPAEIGKIYIGQEYSNSTPENIGYLRQIEPHELAHRQGVHDESLTEIVALSVNGLMAEDGSVDHEYGMLMTFRNDALWTAILMADHPDKLMPSDRDARNVFEGSLYQTYDYHYYASGPSPAPVVPPLERASDGIEAAVEEPVIEYREGAVERTIDRIFAGDPQSERDEFDEIYADWKVENTDVMTSRIIYRITPYLMIREANTEGAADGKLTDYFIGEPAFFGGAIDKEQRTIDTSGVWRELERARESYGKNGN